YRRAAGTVPDGFQRLVRSLRGRTMVRVRSAPQCPAYWSRPHRARPRCCRHRPHDDLRRASTRVVHRLDRRGFRRGAQTTTARTAVVSMATGKEAATVGRVFCPVDMTGATWPRGSPRKEGCMGEELGVSRALVT